MCPHHGFLIGGKKLVSGETFKNPLGVFFFSSCCADGGSNDACDMLQSHWQPPVAGVWVFPQRLICTEV